MLLVNIMFLVLWNTTRFARVPHICYTLTGPSHLLHAHGSLTFVTCPRIHHMCYMPMGPSHLLHAHATARVPHMCYMPTGPSHLLHAHATAGGHVVLKVVTIIVGLDFVQTYNFIVHPRRCQLSTTLTHICRIPTLHVAPLPRVTTSQRHVVGVDDCPVNRGWRRTDAPVSLQMGWYN